MSPAADTAGAQPDVRARLNQVIANAFDRDQLRDLIEERALAQDSMDASRVYRIREEMERAEARRLQPHYIAGINKRSSRPIFGRFTSGKAPMNTGSR